MEVAADLADIALALSGSGILLGLDVGVIVGVGAALVLGQHLGLDDICDVKHLGLDVLYVDDLAGEDGIGILCDIGDAVRHTVDIREVGKLVNVASGLEAEVLEQAVGGFLCEDGDVELARLCDHIAGVVFLDDGYGYFLGVAGGDLAGGVYYAAVVLAVDAGGEDLDAVAEFIEHLVVNVQSAGLDGFGRYGDNGTDIGGYGVGKSVKLGQLRLGDVGLERNGLSDELGAAQLGERFLHEPAGGCRP